MKSTYEHIKDYTIMATILNLFLLTIFLVFMGSCDPAHSAEIPDDIGIRCVIGEASNQGEIGMYALASGLLNRGTIKGVYGCHAKHIDKESAYIWDRARIVWFKAKNKRLHNGDHWENISAFGKPKWAYSMKEVYRYKNHVFYKENE